MGQVIRPEKPEERQRRLYEETMGRPPPEPKPENEPFAWQWTYAGSKVERERLVIAIESRR